MQESEEHAALVELFRRHPELATWLAEKVGGVTLPADHTSSADDPVLRLQNMSADVVVEVRDPSGETCAALAVEIQRDIDPDKKYSWPAYTWLERARRRCPCRVLVIATRKEVARWARKPIYNYADVTHVIVLGPEDVPRITDPSEARANPALAVLSAAMHAGSSDGPAVVRAAARALFRLPVADARQYSNLVFRALDEAAIRLILKDVMQEQRENHEGEEVDPFAGWKAYVRSLEAIGEARGREIGEARGRAQTLLRLLERRGFVVDEDVRVQVLTCTDSEQLDWWFDRAVVVSRIAEVFASRE